MECSAIKPALPLFVTIISHGDLVGEVCSYGPDVIVLEPAGLRSAVIERLTAVAEGER